MKREAEDQQDVEALDEVMGSPDDLRPYMLCDRWNLFELACLLHGAAPELVSGRAHADKQRQLRALGEPHEVWTPKLVRDLIDIAPEMILGATIGGTLKRLKIATAAQTMRHAVTRIEAGRLAEGLGLAPPLDFGARPAPPETTEKRQERRYRMCVEDGLQMPDNDYARLPRGVGRLAEREGVTRPAFTADVKAHIARLANQRKENGK